MAHTQNLSVSVVTMVVVMTMMVQSLHGFSNGVSLVTGDSVFRRVYCQRPVPDRAPIHLSAECGGPCRPRDDGMKFFSLVVDETSYWTDGVNVTLQANEGSAFDVQGFTIYAVDKQGEIVGLLDSLDGEVAVGSCEDVIKNTVEGQFAIHAVARPGRKKVTVSWNPDGFNHGPIKFGAWVVHNHTTIFYVESHELSSEKNSDEPLDLLAMYQALLHDSQANMAQFENAFTQRGNMGYQIDLDDPFAPFNHPPTLADLLPKSRTGSDGTLGGRGFGSPLVDNRAINSGIIDFRKNRKNGRGDGARKGSSGNGNVAAGGDENDYQLISIGEWMKSKANLDRADSTKNDDTIIINNLLLVGFGGGDQNLIGQNEGTPLDDDKNDYRKPDGLSDGTAANNNDTAVDLSLVKNPTSTNTVTDDKNVDLTDVEVNGAPEDNQLQTSSGKQNVYLSNDNLIAPPDEDALKVRKPITETTIIDAGPGDPGVLNDEQMRSLSGGSAASATPLITEKQPHYLEKRSAVQKEPQFKVQAMESSSNSRSALDIFGSPSSSSPSSPSSSSSNQPPAWAMPPQMSQPANPNLMRRPGAAPGNPQNPMMNPRGGQRPPNSPFMQQGRNSPGMPPRGMNGMPMNPSAMQQQRPPFGQQPGGSAMRFPMPNQNGQSNPMMMGSRGGSQPFPMGPQAGQSPFGQSRPGAMQMRDGDDENNPFGAAPMNPFQNPRGQFPQQPGGFGGNPQMAMGPSMGGSMMGNQNPMMGNQNPMMGNQNPMMGNQNPMMSQMMNGMGGQQGFPGSQMGMMSSPGGGMPSPYGQASMGMNGPGGGFSSNPFSSMGMMGRGGGMNGQNSSPFGFANSASMMSGGMGNFMSQNGGSNRGMPGMMNPFMGMGGSNRGGFPGRMPSMGGMSNMGGMSSFSPYSRGGMPSLASMMSRRGMGGFGGMSGMGGMFQRSGGMPGMMPGMMSGMMPGFMGSRSRSG